jgi:hypothetical protein
VVPVLLLPVLPVSAVSCWLRLSLSPLVQHLLLLLQSLFPQPVFHH